nr:hypothetical protein [Terriglobus albidus]
MREPTLDQLHRPFKGDLRRSQQQMNMIGHYDIGMQKVVLAVVIQSVKEQLGIPRNLKDSSSIRN